MRSLQLVIVVVAGGFLTACLDEAPDESSSSHSVTTHNRLGANRLGANRLGANRLGANRLGANRLGANGLVEINRESAEDLLATEEGRDVLSYIVSCALPEGVSLTVPDAPPGTPTEYLGSLGLAPEWIEEPLDAAGKGWVSACLFARVNANEEAVSISLRGSNDALFTTPDEEADYTLQEGGFYGNYFTPIEQPLEWFSCRGRDQAAGEVGGLIDRDCAEPSATDPNLSVCGFYFQGDCFGVGAACKTERDGLFSKCDTNLDDDDDSPWGDHHHHGHHHGWGHGHGHGHAYGHYHHGRGDDVSRQVITVYVAHE